MTGCGYRPAEIDEMTWWDVEALCRYWQDWPPAHEAIAIAYGIERKAAPAEPALSSSDASDPSGIGGLIAQFPGGHVPATR